mgnify:CR=1 FL=1
MTRFTQTNKKAGMKMSNTNNENKTLKKRKSKGHPRVRINDGSYSNDVIIDRTDSISIRICIRTKNYRRMNSLH